MFRCYPYWGWLLPGLLLWCLAGYYYHQHSRAMLPDQMARTVGRDMQRRIDAYEEFINNQGLLADLYTDSLPEPESRRLINYPFYVFAYTGDTLTYWNTNAITATPNDSAVAQPVLIRNEQGVFLEKCAYVPGAGGQRKVVVLFPVLKLFSIDNDYLRSRFAASDAVPLSTQVIPPSQTVNGSYAISLGSGQRVFSLLFNEADIQTWVPDSVFLLILVAALAVSISWIQLITIHIARKKSPFVGFIVTVGVIALIRTLLFKYGLPFNLSSLNFFSSALYASSDYLKSLGDLFISTVFGLWLVVFLARHTPYQTYFRNLTSKSGRLSVTLVLVSGLLAYCFFFVTIIRGLVLDSNISFDANHLYSTSIYPIIGLLVIGMITGLSCLVIYLINVQLTTLVGNKWLKYFFIGVTGAVALWLAAHFNATRAVPLPFDWLFYWSLLGWLLLFLALLDRKNFTVVSDLFEPQMIFWAVFICLFCTALLQYFNQEKEKVTRVAYVNLKLAPQRDPMMESVFDRTARQMEQDPVIKNFFAHPSTAARKGMDQYFDAQYLGGSAAGNYQSRVYLFDAGGHSLYNKDTTIEFERLMTEKEESELTKTSYLFFKDDLHERHFYLSYIPVYHDGINNVLGYIFIDFDQKKKANETAVYPELLQSNVSKSNSLDNEYTYAVYVNGKLNSQTNDFAFATHLGNDTLKNGQDYMFVKNKGVSELHYRISEKRTIVIVHMHSTAIEMITLFSYMFVILVLFATFVLVYQLYLTYISSNKRLGNFTRLTLRRRVHFSMLAVVLLSFVVIGTVTIMYFSYQYRKSSSSKLQSAMQLARQALEANFRASKAFESEATFDSIGKSNNFKSFITTLANSQVIDINIFNREGALLNTSEDDIYNKGVLSNIMRPDAFNLLNDQSKSILIRDEKVEGLSYLSAYQPLRDEHGETFGYINVPFFSSEKELNFQISNIVVTLINLYSFIFLFSSLISVFITRWITKSFDVIIRQFERINLQQNERIRWPYNDEIGLLVAEYNKMVNKVEENAAMLAQSERESAWREMARQVAHEIKNPLTPMKLNIQFLRQAMKNDAPNIKELTDKLTNSIVEQIDNLSYIASEFSNFAKMPEARPEELELTELLGKAVDLYRNDAHVNVHIRDGHEQLRIFSDRSQLLRVFTNLLENAKQSIPEDRQGEIDIMVSHQEGNALITFTDNGTGIPEDVAAKLFQPYFTTKSSGTGLGLAMTKKIIEFWKGEIWFETTVGEGTTFYIRLPLMSQA